jgi:CRP-like cAMP-binding protein
LLALGGFIWRRRFLEDNPASQTRVEAHRLLRKRLRQAREGEAAQALRAHASAALRLAWTARTGEPAQGLSDRELTSRAARISTALAEELDAFARELERLRYRQTTSTAETVDYVRLREQLIPLARRLRTAK